MNYHRPQPPARQEEKALGFIEPLPPGINHEHMKLLAAYDHKVMICGVLVQTMIERFDVSKVTGETVLYRGGMGYDPISKRTERQGFRLKVVDGRAVIEEAFPIKICM